MSNEFIPQLANVPFTTIVNRAQIGDLSKDLKPRMATERITLNDLHEIQNESGPNGEKVFGTNDERVRFVGDNWEARVDDFGIRILTTTSSTDHFAEITFYGTGLNLLTFVDTSDRKLEISLDGGVETTINDFVGSSIITQRGYSQNVVVNAASNLPLDWHTVKVRTSGVTNGEIFGFEILNESTQIYIPEGKFKYGELEIDRAAGGYIDYNTGIVGTKGARSIVQLKTDGSVSVKHNEVDATALYLASTDHSNEEIARKINFREFGANRADDFSTLVSTQSDRAFTLSDGTVTLVGNDVTGGDLTALNTNGAFLTLTFIGTGLSITRKDSFDGGLDDYEAFVDGSSVGDLDGVGSTLSRIVDICSGLSYGAHTVRILRNTAATYNLGIIDFTIYQPKKPIADIGNVEIADYSIMADFVADTTGGLEFISQGINRKDCLREVTYVGTITVNTLAPATYVNASQMVIPNGDYFEYTFTGTGIGIVSANASVNSSDSTVELNGILVTATNFPSATFTTAGNIAFNSTTGKLDQSNASALLGGNVMIADLPFDTYTIKVTNNVANNLRLEALDIITPIHSYKLNNLVKQNELDVGSGGINLPIVKDKGLSKAERITSEPTTTSIAAVPMSDMVTTINSKTGRVKIDANVQTYSDAITVVVTVYLYIDGKEIRQTNVRPSDINEYAITSLFATIDVGVGDHVIQLFWNNNTGATTNAVYRYLEVTDVDK